MKAVFIEQHGDASALHYSDVPKPEPATGEVLVKVAAGLLGLPAASWATPAAMSAETGPSAEGMRSNV